jgi:DNA polymerase III epsilon subunit-like protein
MNSDNVLVPLPQLLMFQSLYYWNLGFNVTHINGLDIPNPSTAYKNPSHDISKLKHSRQGLGDVQAFDWHHATGLGAICGCNDIRCIDIDDCPSFQVVEDLLKLLNLPHNYQWVVQSGSKNGYHVWIRASELPEVLGREREVFPLHANLKYTNYFKRIEIRWSGHTVLPPSKHSYGYNYTFLNCSFPSAAPEYIGSESLSNAVLAMCLEPAGGDAVTVRTTTGRSYSVNFPIYDSFEDTTRGGGYSIIIIDIETTGLPSNELASHTDTSAWPYIVELAWIHTSLWEDGYAENRFVLESCGIDIPQSATDIHGISNDFAKEHGVDRINILTLLAKVINSSHYIVFHNASFDAAVLNCEFHRYGIKCFINIENDLRDRLGNVICTMRAGANYIDQIEPQNKGRWPSLAKLHKALFQEDYDNKHTALSDVRATFKVFKQLKKLGIISRRMNCYCYPDCMCERDYLYYEGLIPYVDVYMLEHKAMNEYMNSLTHEEIEKRRIV